MVPINHHLPHLIEYVWPCGHYENVQVAPAPGIAFERGPHFTLPVAKPPEEFDDEERAGVPGRRQCCRCWATCSLFKPLDACPECDHPFAGCAACMIVDAAGAREIATAERRPVGEFDQTPESWRCETCEAINAFDDDDGFKGFLAPKVVDSREDMRCRRCGEPFSEESWVINPFSVYLGTWNGRIVAEGGPWHWNLEWHRDCAPADHTKEDCYATRKNGRRRRENPCINKNFAPESPEKQAGPIIPTLVLPPGHDDHSLPPPSAGLTPFTADQSFTNEGSFEPESEVEPSLNRDNLTADTNGFTIGDYVGGEDEASAQGHRSLGTEYDGGGESDLGSYYNVPSGDEDELHDRPGDAQGRGDDHLGAQFLDPNLNSNPALSSPSNPDQLHPPLSEPDHDRSDSGTDLAPFLDNGHFTVARNTYAILNTPAAAGYNPPGMEHNLLWDSADESDDFRRDEEEEGADLESQDQDRAGFLGLGEQEGGEEGYYEDGYYSGDDSEDYQFDEAHPGDGGEGGTNRGFEPDGEIEEDGENFPGGDAEIDQAQLGDMEGPEFGDGERGLGFDEEVPSGDEQFLPDGEADQGEPLFLSGDEQQHEFAEGEEGERGFDRDGEFLDGKGLPVDGGSLSGGEVGLEQERDFMEEEGAFEAQSGERGLDFEGGSEGEFADGGSLGGDGFLSEDQFHSQSGSPLDGEFIPDDVALSEGQEMWQEGERGFDEEFADGRDAEFVPGDEYPPDGDQLGLEGEFAPGGEGEFFPDGENRGAGGEFGSNGQDQFLPEDGFPPGGAPLEDGQFSPSPERDGEFLSDHEIFQDGERAFDGEFYPEGEGEFPPEDGMIEDGEQGFDGDPPPPGDGEFLPEDEMLGELGFDGDPPPPGDGEFLPEDEMLGELGFDGDPPPPGDGEFLPEDEMLGERQFDGDMEFGPEYDAGFPPEGSMFEDGQRDFDGDFLPPNGGEFLPENGMVGERSPGFPPEGQFHDGDYLPGPNLRSPGGTFDERRFTDGDFQDRGFPDTGFRDDNFRNEGFQDGGFQDGGFQDANFQNGGFRDDGFQNRGFPNDSVRDDGFQDRAFPDDSFRDDGFQSGGPLGDNYPGSGDLGPPTSRSDFAGRGSIYGADPYQDAADIQRFSSSLPEGEPFDGEFMNGSPPNERSLDEEPLDGQSFGDESFNRGSFDGRFSNEPLDGQSFNGQPLENGERELELSQEPIDAPPLDEREFDDQSLRGPSMGGDSWETPLSYENPDNFDQPLDDDDWPYRGDLDDPGLDMDNGSAQSRLEEPPVDNHQGPLDDFHSPPPLMDQGSPVGGFGGPPGGFQSPLPMDNFQPPPSPMDNFRDSPVGTPPNDFSQGAEFAPPLHDRGGENIPPAAMPMLSPGPTTPPPEFMDGDTFPMVSGPQYNGGECGPMTPLPAQSSKFGFTNLLAKLFGSTEGKQGKASAAMVGSNAKAPGNTLAMPMGDTRGGYQSDRYLQDRDPDPVGLRHDFDQRRGGGYNGPYDDFGLPQQQQPQPRRERRGFFARLFGTKKKTTMPGAQEHEAFLIFCLAESNRGLFGLFTGIFGRKTSSPNDTRPGSAPHQASNTRPGLSGSAGTDPQQRPSQKQEHKEPGLFARLFGWNRKARKNNAQDVEMANLPGRSRADEVVRAGSVRSGSPRLIQGGANDHSMRQSAWADAVSAADDDQYEDIDEGYSTEANSPKKHDKTANVSKDRHKKNRASAVADSPDMDLGAMPAAGGRATRTRAHAGRAANSRPMPRKKRPKKRHLAPIVPISDGLAQHYVKEPGKLPTGRPRGRVRTAAAAVNPGNWFWADVYWK
ncbi:hypothetical protein VTK26DRAFT_8259 [Humicola hyalothermophila]